MPTDSPQQTGKPQQPQQAPYEPGVDESPGVNANQREIQALKAAMASLTEIVQRLRTNLNNPRVRIQNLEGVFKVVSTVPSNSDDYQDGSILLYDDGSSTRRLYAKMNKTWRYTALT